MVEILIASREKSFLFSLADLTWRAGPPLPEKLDQLVSVQLDSGFMVIGGRDEEEMAVDNIYTIDYEHIWLNFPTTLDQPKYSSVGVEVPLDFYNC